MEANDMKAMREALEAVRNLAYEVQDMNKEGDVKTSMPTAWVIDTVNAALSRPPRNCDRFADAETARQAWLDDAENWDDFGSPRLELHEWLFALAAEQKGDRA